VLIFVTVSPEKPDLKLRLTFGKVALLTTAIGLVIGGGLAYLGYRLVEREFPDVAVLKSKYPQVIYRGSKTPVQVRLVNSPPAGWTRIESIAKPAMGAIVVSEDWAFFSHEGFDANQLREAIKEDIADRRFSRGASTITMQVVKNVFLSHEKTLYRKAKEFVLAIRLDHHVPKKRILEVYFNIAEWGEGIFGIGAASQKYFGKHPSELTPKEGAFLAMLLPSPKRYSQSFRDKKLTNYARRTVNSILDKMSRANYITEEERDIELAKRLPFERGEEMSTDGSTLTPDSETLFEGDEETETPRELDQIPFDGENT
jgi:monofunctional biosynthetic peptidoglycan transglycosylase